MGRIAVLLSFVRSLAGESKVSDVKVDPGGGANVTAQHFAPAGDDSHPLPDDYAATMPVPRTGSEVAIGYLDPNNEQKAQAGEKRIYARDPEDGSVVVEVWLENDGTALIANAEASVETKPDGSIKGSNSAGSFELQAGGNFVVNGVTIDTGGNVTIPTSLNLGGKEIAGHSHSQANDSGGNTEQDTGPNN